MIVISGYEFENLGVVINSQYVNLTVSWNGSFEDLESIVRGAAGTFSIDDKEYFGYDLITTIRKNYETATYTIALASTESAESALEVITGKENATYSDAVQFRNEIQTVVTYIPEEEAENYDWMFNEWSGDSVAYKVGDRVKYFGLLYKCIQAHTSQSVWAPDVAVSLWVRIANPAEEWPEWIQPLGAQDAYQVGDKVSHNDKHWQNNTANNVWEPGVYGWDEVN